jgi:hypothetical protein
MNHLDALASERKRLMSIDGADALVAEYHDIHGGTLGWGWELKMREAYPNTPAEVLVTGLGLPGEKELRKVVGRELIWIESQWVDWQ